MLRIGSMNMLLHGVESPDIRYRDSLSAGPRRRGREATRWSSPTRRSPGRLDYENTAKDLLAGRQDEEDRAALPRPLPPAAQARRPRRGHRPRRRAVRLEQGAQGRCAACWSRTRSSTPSSSSPPASSSPTPASPPRSCSSPRPTPAAPTTSGSTTSSADGWSLDDKRTPLLPEEKLGPGPRRRSTDGEHEKNNLPDVLARWAAARRRRTRAPAHRAELLRPQGRHRRQGYDLSLNRYKEVVHEEVEHRPPKRDHRRAARPRGRDPAGLAELKAMVR